MSAEEILQEATDPQRSAERAGLHYVRDDEPGITRRRCGRGFAYLDADGAFITDPETKARFEALAIPPAYTDVWICRSPSGHLQATGRDEKGRKQYIYHPEWERVRNEAKFDRLIPFGAVLPEVRARYDRDLRRRTLSRERVLAAVTALLDRTLIRIGNPEYAQKNGSYGLTTLRDRHVDFTSRRVTFSFRGKSGKEHTIALDDRRLARIVRHCRDIPGYDLFQYYDDDGDRQTIGSADVNAYLRETTGADFTAKDFRTWGGTVQAAHVLHQRGPAEGEAEQVVVDVIKEVAACLGNTPAICRTYYIHPAILEGYVSGDLLPAMAAAPANADSLLEPHEQAVLHVLRRRLGT